MKPHSAMKQAQRSTTMRIALIAHDNKKLDMAMFVRDHIDIFRQHELVATSGTGKILQEKTGLTVERITHGPDGGDLIIGARVAMGQIDAVIFFRDPLTAQPHEPDVSALLRVCDVHNVPLATNLGTAEAIVDWLTDMTNKAKSTPQSQ
ncbi:methylglyoxal synthase [Ardenticatena maritima]|uniref:Methylglyoxal synthase n=2 Tax=Ardenticatena maritima TaxID=872965 RepID=A0A0M9UBK2_9CHLR|nr:methylglyoxal synthase [Ardenticatena maritima]